ncbi:NAD(P)-dependent dehydrogenase (short-subunit alcohol dehydrogenase family) [Pseudomonas sp. AG1028]|uniref:SDR family oxidoreductase n=1 Tax=Pseudomonas sp. AG1028 TaxID=2572911 RepID=UPI0011ADB4B0|nr:SDR family oxidoreductase [Pseudomonas sp. AG1028]TWE09735.1 NAD(P)-dependent dehydrogenase (short-subunit alcohol dehydrogenase family) [Pseudomonas sp. AG1028]
MNAAGEVAHGRVALVTGAARGIGEGVAHWLLEHGWRVALCDLAGSQGAEVAAALGEHAAFVAMDVSDETQVAQGVAAVIERFGRLDALVCNAGVASPHSGPLQELSLEQWNQVLAINLSGPMLLAKHCAAHLRATGGTIVNMASTRASQSEPESEAYAASKGGLIALTHALAISLGPSIRVNAVSPGWIDSRDAAQRASEPLSVEDHAQHPVGRVGQVEDVAALVAWLLSPEAGFVTGQEFVTDGGMTRKMIYR